MRVILILAVLFLAGCEKEEGPKQSVLMLQMLMCKDSTGAMRSIYGYPELRPGTKSPYRTAFSVSMCGKGIDSVWVISK
jgi:hypothetical protein